MPIVLRHEAAGIPAGQNPNRKYGQSMVLQQQHADQNMRLRAQDAQYDMQRIGAMAQMRQPSIGEEASMLDQEIRSGLYDSDTVRALRDDERMIGQIMRDRRIDGTQRAQALENIQSRMRMMRATGKRMEPTMQAQPSAQNQQMTVQQKPPMTEAEFFEVPANYKESRATAIQQIQESNGDLTEDNIHAQMHNNYLGRQRWMEQIKNPKPAVPAPAPGVPAQGGQPQASYSGGNVSAGFGVAPVLAQGGFQGQAMGSQVGGSAYQPTGDINVPMVYGASPVLANTAQQQQSIYEEPVSPSPYQIDRRNPPAQIYDDMVYTAEMQERDRRNPPIQNLPYTAEEQERDRRNPPVQLYQNAVYTAEQQERDRRNPPIKPIPNFNPESPGNYLAYASQPAQQQQPQYPMEAVSGTKFDPNATVPRDPTGLDSRKWTSADGKFSTAGKIVGVTPPTEDGGFSTVRIKRDDTGKIVDVPMNKLSQQDQVFVLSKGSGDAMYREQNPGMTAGLAIMDPNNPVRQEMSAADQSIVNPQKQTLGEPGGARGLGRINYGQGPSGQNVYADIVPGGIMPVPAARGATPEEQAYDKAAKEKYQDWRNRTGRGSVIASPDQAPAADNALTKLLATMTPSQRRDYSKWLMEEPNRYAMRNEIAQQQLNQNAAAKRSGQLPTYPGKEARKQQGRQQGQAPTQGQPMQAPMQPQAPLQVPMQPQALTQAPMQPQAPVQAQTPQVQAPAQGQAQQTPIAPVKEERKILPMDSKEVRGAIDALTSPYSTQEQLMEAVKILGRSEVSESQMQEMRKQRQKAIYDNWRSGKYDKRETPPPEEQKGIKADVIEDGSQAPPAGQSSPPPILSKPSKYPGQALPKKPAGAIDTSKGQKGVTASVIDAAESGYGSDIQRPVQESRDWKKWWSTQVPAFEASGEEASSTWTRADGKKSFDGTVLRISRPADGTRYVSIKGDDGRIYSMDVNMLSEADRKRLESMYGSRGKKRSSKSKYSLSPFADFEKQ